MLAVKLGFDDSLALCHRAESEEGQLGKPKLGRSASATSSAQPRRVDVTASQLDAKNPGQPARFSYAQKLKKFNADEGLIPARGRN